MAKQYVVMLTDDIDGSEGAETVEFGIDGVLYSIDLSAGHAEELRDRLTAYREFGTHLGRYHAPRGTASTPASGPRRQGNRERNRDVRRWAQEQGLPVKARGTLSPSLVEQYEAVHPISA